MTEKVNPMPGQVLLKDVEFDSGYDVLDRLDKTTDIAEANAITSVIADDPEGLHKLILDVDFPVQAIPSTTPGHYHLYIDKALSWDDLEGVFTAMADAGLVERGYARACSDQRFTTVRLPWVKKETKK